MNNDNKFPEQEAPEKNTDKAFVKVGENGEPVVPSENEEKKDIEKGDHSTSLEHR